AVAPIPPFVAYPRETRIANTHGESLRVRERGDRARQVAVRRGISAERSRDERREPMEVEAVRDADDRVRRRGELEDHGATAGSEHATHLAQADREVAEVAHREGGDDPL